MTILLIAKVTLLFAAALLAAAIARIAATRHALLAGAQLAALILPFLVFAMPPLRVLPTQHPRTPTLDPPAFESPSPRERGEGARRADEGLRTATIIEALWLTGLALIAINKALSYARAHAIARRAVHSGAVGSQPTGGLRARRSTVLHSDEVHQPAAFGRRILLPMSARGWSDDKLRIVLLHEQAHVERRDTLHGIISDVACAVYWFHPLAWIVAHRAGLERERACDDRVLNAGVAADRKSVV